MTTTWKEPTDTKTGCIFGNVKEHRDQDTHVTVMYEQQSKTKHMRMATSNTIPDSPYQLAPRVRLQLSCHGRPSHGWTVCFAVGLQVD